MICQNRSGPSGAILWGTYFSMDLQLVLVLLLIVLSLGLISIFSLSRRILSSLAVCLKGASKIWFASSNLNRPGCSLRVGLRDPIDWHPATTSTPSSRAGSTATIFILRPALEATKLD